MKKLFNAKIKQKITSEDLEKIEFHYSWLNIMNDNNSKLYVAKGKNENQVILLIKGQHKKSVEQFYIPKEFAKKHFEIVNSVTDSEGLRFQKYINE